MNRGCDCPEGKRHYASEPGRSCPKGRPINVLIGDDLSYKRSKGLPSKQLSLEQEAAKRQILAGVKEGSEPKQHGGPVTVFNLPGSIPRLRLFNLATGRLVGF